MKNIKKRLRAFTILELLLVVVVIGVIAAMVLAKFGDVKEGAYIDAMKNDLRNLANAQEFYHEENGTYSEISELPGFYFSDGVEVSSSSATSEEWTAVLAHNSTSHTCAITVGKSLTASNKMECTSDGEAGGSAPEATNTAPVADFSWDPTAPAPGEVVSFNGTLSSDADGDALTYDWSINGTSYSTAEPTHTFASAGDYLARLTVFDGVAANTLDETITVALASPAVKLWYHRDGENALFYRLSTDLGVEHEILRNKLAFAPDRGFEIDEVNQRAVVEFYRGGASYVYLYNLTTESAVTSHNFSHTQGIGLDVTTGQYFLSEAGNDRTRIYNSAGTAQHSYYDPASGGGPTEPVSDNQNDRIMWGNGPNKTLETSTLSASGTISLLANDVRPYSRTVPDPDRQRVLYVSDSVPGTIRVVNYDGTGDTLFWTTPNGETVTRLQRPNSATYDYAYVQLDGSKIYALDLSDGTAHLLADSWPGGTLRSVTPAQ